MFSINGDIHNLNIRPKEYDYESNYIGSEEQIRDIQKLPTLLNISNNAKLALNSLIVSIGTSNNLDTENNINIDKMLYELYHLVSEKERNHEIVEIYLLEMLSGMCPPGRGFRMYQMLFVLRDC